MANMENMENVLGFNDNEIREGIVGTSPEFTYQVVGGIKTLVGKLRVGRPLFDMDGKPLMEINPKTAEDRQSVIWTNVEFRGSRAQEMRDDHLKAGDTVSVIGVYAEEDFEDREQPGRYITMKRIRSVREYRLEKRVDRTRASSGSASSLFSDDIRPAVAYRGVAEDI